MSDTTHKFDPRIKAIDAIDFEIWSNNDILRGSTFGKDSIGIDTNDLYDKNNPRIGGLLDTRLGTTDNNNTCERCGLNANDCPGHFGHITFAAMVFNMNYTDVLKKILGCTCIECSKLLIYKNEKEIEEMKKTRSGKRRLDEIKQLVKGVHYCQKKNHGCGAPVWNIKREINKQSGKIQMKAEIDIKKLMKEGSLKESGNMQIKEALAEGKSKLAIVLSPEKCFRILSSISDRDLEIMGINPKKTRPEDMIHKYFPVPPVQVRPSVKADFMSANSTMEDDLTHKLADIIRHNMAVRDEIEDPEKDFSFKTSNNFINLQYHEATYMNSEQSNLPQATQKGKVIKSLASRLKSKEGRIRGNLMGKRVNFSARTVITPDPTIDINQLGVPRKIAMKVTFPEIVTPHNREWLQKLVRNGPTVYPGANTVIPLGHFQSRDVLKPWDLRFRKDQVDLKLGDIVERHLIDDDYVLLNRQPTLHKLSMMGHRAKIIDNDDYQTFRLNVAITTPYNADFDGDEMNIFVPQSDQAAIELEEIADAKRQIISPRTSLPIIGPVQDGLLGSYNLTDPSLEIDWRVAMNIISYTSVDSFKSLKKNTMYKGKDIFSLIIPNKINSEHNGLKIKKGKIIEGRVRKAHIGAEKEHTLVHLIWEVYGINQTQKFLDDIQRIVNNFNLWRGFSVGYRDIQVSDEIKKSIEVLYETKKLDVFHYITEMENNPELLDPNIFEGQVYGSLDTIRDTASKMIMENLSKDNNFNIMITSGSKGGPINMGQMGGCIGQQGVEGVRVKKKVNGRTLPYFHQNDDGPIARGFVLDPFVTGIEPESFIFHNMSAREGLIDTAIKSVTGDTPVIINENGIIKYVKIGDWIDEHLDSNKEKVKHYPERELELLDVMHQLHIPTTDSKGNVSWGQVTALTRHDPGKELYEIKTHGGRKVIVTESKSLLIWKESSKSFEHTSTPSVKIGDFVPVTIDLPVMNIINEIDTSKYFSKDQYLHGTDFNKALSELDKEMDKVEFPDRFKLDYDNGIMFGLYLAEGNVCNGYINITNNNIGIQSFVKNWFAKYSITSHENEKINAIGGTSHSIRGFSTLMATFFKKTMGHGAREKYIPDFSINANEDFVKGLLNGYFSGDGTVTTNSIQVGSASSRLVEGITMLLNRLGIFGKLTITRMKHNNIGTKNMADINLLSIRAQWAQIFADKIELIDNKKQNKLNTIKPSLEHRNFRVSNNVTLDPIVEINKIDVKKYPKVYDLTVPSTINFGLANGLHVVDTAQSGYVQRKLIKLMEDGMIKYDNTVRGSNNGILQFIYGDSGINAIKMSEHKSSLYKMTNKEVEDKFMFSKSDISKFKKYTEKDNIALYRKLINMRNKYCKSMTAVTQDYGMIMSQYMLPINLNRIIESYKDSDTIKNDKLEPDYVITHLEKLLEYESTQVNTMSKKEAESKKNVSNKMDDERICKSLFEYAIHEFLAPKRCILEYKFNKEQFDNVFNTIVYYFNKAIVEPGEMVGIIGAQSIGEPVTQLTLNSVDYSTKIILDNNGSIEIVKIGEFIEKMMNSNKNVKHMGDNHDKEMEDTYYLDTNNDNYKALTTNPDGTLVWNSIEALTKHLPINKDGSRTILKVITRGKLEVRATKAKSFLTRKNNEIVPIRGDELKIGTRIPVITKFIPENINKYIELSEYLSKKEYTYRSEIPEKIELTEQFGFFIGAYLAEGLTTDIYISIANYDKKVIKMITNLCDNMLIDYNVTEEEDKHEKGWTYNNVVIHSHILSKLIKQTCDTKSANKKVPDFAFNAPDNFVKGVINGYLSSNGIVNKQLDTIIFSSISKELIDGIQMLLRRFNIISRVGLMYIESNNGKSTNVKPSNTLTVSSGSLKVFCNTFSSVIELKQNRMDDIKEKQSNYKYKRDDIIPGIYGSELNGSYSRDKLIDMIKEFPDHKDKDIIIKAINSEMIFDEIIEIVELEPETKYVYDLTVKNNRNFTLANGIIAEDTFHHTGIASMGTSNLGVSRINELMSFSENIKEPIMKIYLDKQSRGNKILANKIASYIEYTTIGNLMNKVDIHYDPDPYTKGSFMDKDQVKPFYSISAGKNSCQADVQTLPWLIRVEIDREKLLTKEITLLEIKSKFCDFWSRRFTDSKSLKKEEKAILDKVSQMAILSNKDNSKQPVIHFRMDIHKYSYDTFITLFETVIQKFKLKGIDGINAVRGVADENIVVFDEDGTMRTEKEYIIYTDGININDLHYLNHIDMNRTYTNNVVINSKYYGIETARASLLKELSMIVKGTNYQHISVLMDIMTSRGALITVDRNGITKVDADPLSRASFEKTVDQLITASVFSERDHMNSVSSRIMAGQVIKGGTGLVDIVVDLEKIRNSEHLDATDKDESTFKKVRTDAIMDEIIEEDNEDSDTDNEEEDFIFEG